MSVEPVFKKRYTVKERTKVLSRFAAVFDALIAGEDKRGAILDGRVMRGLAIQGFITAAEPHEATPTGLAWRAGYTGTPAPLASVSSRQKRIHRKRPNATPRLTSQAAPKPAAAALPNPKPLQVARDLIAAGLIFLHPKMVEDLTADELALWLKAKRHERDGLTLTALARLLGEPVAHVRIRAQRIRERGYVLAVVDDENEEAA